MNHIISFLRFWYDFIVGDDWTVAAAVVVALSLTGLLAKLEGSWLILPGVVLGFLGVSLWRVVRRN